MSLRPSTDRFNHNRYSVRLISCTDNRAGGNRLDEMYTLNRVLDNDPFYVKITD
ncbi:hypothetical protein OG762_47695 (plasmid) [Streptomyces sp. NBC_01136]|uniref:hypothetical protein n=1 Tax=unclassified Streptomyces TaxID=2593676 RepID=UPI002F90FC5A|nr:hypothetical protein OG762_47695 [Streptomyces sp. NBC_01136]